MAPRHMMVKSRKSIRGPRTSTPRRAILKTASQRHSQMRVQRRVFQIAKPSRAYKSREPQPISETTTSSYESTNPLSMSESTASSYESTKLLPMSETAPSHMSETDNYGQVLNISHRTVGFEGMILEKIVGATKLVGDCKNILFLVKWKDMETPELVSNTFMNISYPDEVITYYESITKWLN